MDFKQTGFADSSSQFQLSYPAHRQETLPPDDTKVSYDDLTDDYHSPYASKPSPSSYSFSASVGEHRRRPSQPLSQKPSFLTKASDDDESFASHLYPPTPPQKELVEKTGFWAKIIPDSMACRLYLLVVLLETAVDLALEAQLYVLVKTPNGEDESQREKQTSAYLSIFALAHVFQFVLAVDAVHARNTLQFIFLACFNAMFLLYAIVQISEYQTIAKGSNPDVPSTIDVGAVKILTTIIPIVIAVSQAAYIGLGWKIYNEFGWKVYKFLGADRQIKKMYASYQVFECLVKFDVFFWAGFSVQFIWLVLSERQWEFYVTVAALPVSILLLFEGHLAARHENKWMMATFMSGCACAMIYFIYKLGRVLSQRHLDPYKDVYKTLTVFSVLSICLLVATSIYSVIVMRNFGRGLKGALEKRSQLNGSPNTHNRAASVTLNRMSIN